MSNVININSSKMKLDDVISEKKEKKKHPEKKSSQPDASDEIQEKSMIDLFNQELTSKQHTTEEKTETENNEEKQRMIMILNRYKTSKRFSKFLHDEMKINLSQESLSKKTQKQLEKLLDDVRLAVENKNNNGFFNDSIIKGIAGLESILRDYYRIDGLAVTLQKDEIFLDDLEQLTIENAPFTRVPPKIRIMINILKTAYFINQSHTYMETLSKTNPQAFEKLGNHLQQIKVEKDIEKNIGSDFEAKYNDILK